MKQVIQTGDAVDLFDLPIITHNEMNLGPYLTAGSAWVKDPDNGWTNCAIIRIFVHEPKRLVVNFNAARHMAHIFRKYKEREIPSLPMVVVVGHHPAFYMGAQTKLLTDEIEIIGGVMGQGLEMVPSETWGKDIMVPPTPNWSSRRNSPLRTMISKRHSANTRSITADKDESGGHGKGHHPKAKCILLGHHAGARRSPAA